MGCRLGTHAFHFDSLILTANGNQSISRTREVGSTIEFSGVGNVLCTRRSEAGSIADVADAASVKNNREKRFS